MASATLAVLKVKEAKRAKTTRGALVECLQLSVPGLLGC